MLSSLPRRNRPKPALIILSPLLTCVEELTVSVRSADGLGIPILSIRATGSSFEVYVFPSHRPGQCRLDFFLSRVGPVSIQSISYPKVFPPMPFIEESLFLLCTETFFLQCITESQLLFHNEPIIYCKVFDKCIFFYFITL